jgi:phospholipid/cholesterol/gamma-HCH transport system ATP-binding protein
MKQISTALIPAIEFRGVTITFDENPLLQDISFMVPRGRMQILIGPSNSGKSTLIRLAIGLLKPDAGQIFINGQEITSLTEEEMMEVRLQTGVVLQTDALFSMSVSENTAYRLQQQGMNEAEIEAEVRRVLHVVGLDEAYEMMPDELSGGMSRRAAVARALAGSPEIMFYDSPCSGLDPIISRRLLREIIRQRDIDGISSLYVTQNLDEVRYLCSHFYEPLADEKLRLRREGNSFCLTNTKVMMLREGQIIFNHEDEFLWSAAEQNVREFLS